MFIVLLEADPQALWEDLVAKAVAGSLSRDEKDLYRKLRKTIEHLQVDPRHPGLQSHEIEILTQRYGVKIWQSYLENMRSGARRVFWVYGPQKKEITILAVENHPPTSVRGYRLIHLPADGAIKRMTTAKKQGAGKVRGSRKRKR